MRGKAGSVLVVLGLAVCLPAPVAGQSGTAPALHLRSSAEELLEIAYPARYGGDPRVIQDDIEWVREHDDELIEWWERQGPLFLLRASDMAGLPWPYRDIEVYLVRNWPVVSIEYPLVLALDAVQGPGGSAVVPRDDDLRVLLLAHQVVHYLLDDPPGGAAGADVRTYEHPFMTPGSFEGEALVNWVTYTALEDLWGRARLDRATGSELWRAYNPNHEFVVQELMRGRRLSRTAPLSRWLAENPRGSSIFRVADDYRRRAGVADRPAGEAAPGLSGTAFGIDLGASYDGRIFVAYVDTGSAADRAGLLQGDVVRTIEGRAVGTDVVDAQRRLRDSWEENREINLSVERAGREVYLTLRGG